MVQAIYTTGPVNNSNGTNDAEQVVVNILNRNTSGGQASVTVKVFNVAGGRTLIASPSQQILTVPQNSGSFTISFNTQPTTAFEVVVFVDHPTNVDKVLVSVWGSDATTGYLAHSRFAHEEMHRLS